MKLLRKYWFHIVTAVAFLLLAFFMFIYNDYIKVKQNTILTDKYKQTAENMRSRIANLLLIKEKSTLAIALSLASNESLKEHILQKKVPRKYYEELIQRYKKNTLYQNIWIQVMNKEGISLYRSWTEDKGDNLFKVRREISVAKKEQIVSYAISIGRYDFSIKAMIPIFYQGKFIGLIEIISHFNSIAKILKDEKIGSVVLAEKEQSKHLIHPFTKMFLKEYYIANYAAPKKLRDILLKYGVENFFNKEYVIKDNYFIVDYQLKNITGKTIGHYLAFKKLDSIKSKDLAHFKFRWIVFTLLFLMSVAGIINIAMFYRMRQQKIYYKNIIDSSHNIILLNDRKSIIDANRTFFKYFTQYKTLDAFKEENTCICSFFVVEEGYMKKESETYAWLDAVLDFPEQTHKVKMNIEGKIYYFLINAALISEEKEHYSVIFSDITKEEIYKNELEKINTKDTLTNIYNRRYYENQIEVEMKNAKRYHYDLSVVMIDIDFFKKINDEHGHSVGDEVLVHSAKLIENALRKGDAVCRIGGEEFMIILPHTKREDAQKIAEKLRVLIENDREVIPVTMSFGVAQYIHGEEKDYLYKRVDIALYKAKENGRNRVEVG